MSITTQTLQIRRHHPSQFRWQVEVLPALAEGEVLLRLERFGLSANNVTYAALADALRYGDFFPDASQTDWSSLPVWGTASVVSSRSALVERGQRLFGYFPCASLSRLQPAAATTDGFVVERPALPPQYGFYHRYAIAGRDPLDAPALADAMVVLRPLFLTSLLLADYLQDARFADVEQIVISSAGSKTALGLSAALADSSRQLVGLSSRPLPPALQGLAHHDRALSYAQLEQLPRRPTVYVDFRGSAVLRSQLAGHLGPHLQHVLSVGLTDWQGGAAPVPQSDAPHEVFFAPGWAARRSRDPAFAAALVDAYQRLLGKAAACLPIRRCHGQSGICAAWTDLVDGRQDEGTLQVAEFAPAPVALRIESWQPQWAPAFRALNEAWLRRYFAIEPIDARMLADPQGEILGTGGFIYFALLEDRPVGTCALLRHSDGSLELTKMAVDESLQGLGIGRRLIEAAIEQARCENVQLFLESHHRLAAALALYRHMGFEQQTGPKPGSHYQRSDVYMIWREPR